MSLTKHCSCIISFVCRYSQRCSPDGSSYVASVHQSAVAACQIHAHITFHYTANSPNSSLHMTTVLQSRPVQKSEYKSVGAILLQHRDVSSHHIHLLITVVEVTGARTDHDIHRDRNLLLDYTQQTYRQTDRHPAVDIHTSPDQCRENHCRDMKTKGWLLTTSSVLNLSLKQKLRCNQIELVQNNINRRVTTACESTNQTNNLKSFD